MEMVVAGGVSALAMIFLLLKMDIRKVAGYDIYVDVFFTFLLAYLFSGTYSGMFAALIGGLILSIFLFVAKKTLGYKRLTRKGWVEFPGQWSIPVRHHQRSNYR